MNVSEVANRLLRIIAHANETYNSFAKKIGYTTQSLYDIRDGKVKNISKGLASVITEHYPELNKNWILTGEGDPYTFVKPEVITPEGDIQRTSKRSVKKKSALIPFYNADFIAGNAEIYYEDATIYPEYYLDVPEFSGCTAFRAFSDSMEKIIRSGSTLFGTKIEDWKSHLEPGQIYGITCTDGRRYLKYIRTYKENPKTHFLLRSENENYDDFPLPKDKIKNIWLIEGWINKTT